MTTDLEFDVETAIDTRLAQRTAAEIERERKYQEEQKKKLAVGDPRLLYAERAIEMALHNLEQGTTDAALEYTRLAEGYYLQGDFRKAADTTRDPVKKAEYEAYANAKPGKCTCPIQTVNGDRISPRFVKETFPGLRSIIYCTTCKTHYETIG